MQANRETKKIKTNMLYIIAIVVAFIFLAISEEKNATKKQQKSFFTEEQIEHLQSVGFITDEEIQKYRNNNQII
jgi:uncharacterized protein involved in exopolysaccharide biosynthesis